MATKTAVTAKPQPLASTAEVAAMLGIPSKTLVEWRSRSIGPEYLKVGRYVRYRWSAVNAWLDTREAGKGAA
jgi:predicted DNA-binding transcriptional regulator AlpA